jgi:hypothetical protein
MATLLAISASYSDAGAGMNSHGSSIKFSEISKDELGWSHSVPLNQLILAMCSMDALSPSFLIGGRTVIDYLF